MVAKVQSYLLQGACGQTSHGHWMWDQSRHGRIVGKQVSDRNVLTRLTKEESTGRFSVLIYVTQAFLKVDVGRIIPGRSTQCRLEQRVKFWD